MKILSSLVRNIQAQNYRRVHEILRELKPGGVDTLNILESSPTRIKLCAVIGAQPWAISIASTFHGPCIKVENKGDREMQSFLSKSINLALKAGELYEQSKNEDQ